MKKKFTDILNSAHKHREYSLLDAERTKMTRVLSEYMAHKPLRNESYSVSVSYSWFSFSYRPMIAAFALVCIFGGSISYAAEGALPGDALYAVKTFVNEPTRLALASNSEARAEIQIELAERRIDEASTLAAEGRLDSEIQASLATAFEAHAAAVSENIEETDVEDSPAAAELASRFEMRLAAHDEILTEIELDPVDATFTNAIHGAGRSVASLRARVEEKASVSAPITLAIAPAAAIFSLAVTEEAATDVALESTTTAEANAKESEAQTSRTAERMRSAAQKRYDAMRKILEKNSGKMDADARMRIEEQLSKAKEFIEKGEEERKDNEHAVAFHAFQDSLAITEKLDVMLKAAPNLAKVQSRRNSARTEIRNAKAKKIDATATSVAQDPTEAATVHIEDEKSDDGRDTMRTDIETRIQKFIPPSIKIFPAESDDDEDKEEEEENKVEDSLETEIKIDISIFSLRNDTERTLAF